MKNSYLIEVIKALLPNERQEIGHLLANAQHNREGNAKELALLYQVILQSAPDFSDDLLLKGRVYFHIYAEKTMVPGKLEKLMTDLNRFLRNQSLLKEYLSEGNEVQRQLEWSAWLRKRGLAERAQKVLAKLQKLTEQQPAESLGQYRTQLQMAEEEHELESRHNLLKGDLGIPPLVYALDAYYFNYRTELTNRYLLQQKATKLTDWDPSSTGLEFHRTARVLLQISQKIHETLSNEFPSVEQTQQLMQLLQDHEADLSFQALDHFYGYLRNFCTLLINTGNLAFIPILHAIHKDNLQRGYFNVEGEIPPNAYLNLVQVAIRSKEIAWAKKFTVDYKEKIVGGDENAFFYRLNMAECLFMERNYDQSLDYLPDTPSGSHYYRIVRKLELKIYYELRSDLLQYKPILFENLLTVPPQRLLRPISGRWTSIF